MQFKLVRETLTDDSTIGKLYVDGVFHCFTLEDKVRDVKIPHITAIPKGKYEVVITFSNRFQQLMPLLLNVPGFEGVRIHWGNYSKDTDGCILLGSSKAVNMIGNSQAAYKKFFAMFKSASKKEKSYLEIV